MKKKILVILSAALAAGIMIAGCSGNNITVDEKTITLKPGTYIGQSTEKESEDGGGYTIVRLTIGQDNKIEDVQLEIYDNNGKNKLSEDYGKTYGEITDKGRYEKARNAAEAAKGYADQYLAVQSLSEIDAVSGATISYEQFIEAADIALQKAAEQDGQ